VEEGAGSDGVPEAEKKLTPGGEKKGLDSLEKENNSLPAPKSSLMESSTGEYDAAQKQPASSRKTFVDAQTRIRERKKTTTGGKERREAHQTAALLKKNGSEIRP